MEAQGIWTLLRELTSPRVKLKDPKALKRCSNVFSNNMEEKWKHMSKLFKGKLKQSVLKIFALPNKPFKMNTRRQRIFSRIFPWKLLLVSAGPPICSSNLTCKIGSHVENGAAKIFSTWKIVVNRFEFVFDTQFLPCQHSYGMEKVWIVSVKCGVWKNILPCFDWVEFYFRVPHAW